MAVEPEPKDVAIPDSHSAAPAAPPNRGTRSGYLLVALAAVLWAASGVSAKFLFNGGMDAFQLVQLRTTLAWWAMLVWLLLRKAPLPKIASRDWPYFAGLGVLGIGGAQFFYLYAISQIQVAAAILLHYLGPVFIAVYAAVFAGERLSRVTVIAIAMALAGCGLVVEAHRLDMLAMNLAGMIGGLCAALAFATYSVMGEYGMHRYGPRTVLFYGFLFAAGICNVLHPPLQAFFHGLDLVQWAFVVFIAVAGTVLPFGLYFQGINRIRATHAGITATLEPIAAAVISWLCLGEALGPAQIAGGVLVLAAVVRLQHGRRSPETDGGGIKRLARRARSHRFPAAPGRPAGVNCTGITRAGG
jgi:drug/metabolite transporter (DMT)-like permease